jgi:hypothetical protein
MARTARNNLHLRKLGPTTHTPALPAKCSTNSTKNILAPKVSLRYPLSPLSRRRAKRGPPLTSFNKTTVDNHMSLAKQNLPQAWIDHFVIPDRTKGITCSGTSERDILYILFKRPDFPQIVSFIFDADDTQRQHRHWTTTKQQMGFGKLTIAFLVFVTSVTSLPPPSGSLLHKPRNQSGCGDVGNTPPNCDNGNTAWCNCIWVKGCEWDCDWYVKYRRSLLILLNSTSGAPTMQSLA